MDSSLNPCREAQTSASASVRFLSGLLVDALRLSALQKRETRLPDRSQKARLGLLDFVSGKVSPALMGWISAAHPPGPRVKRWASCLVASRSDEGRPLVSLVRQASSALAGRCASLIYPTKAKGAWGKASPAVVGWISAAHPPESCLGLIRVGFRICFPMR
jgi:hypothetical protein